MNFSEKDDFEVELVRLNGLHRVYFPVSEEGSIIFPSDTLLQEITKTFDGKSLSLFHKRHKSFIFTYCLDVSQSTKQLLLMGEICRIVFDFYREYFLELSIYTAKHLHQSIRKELLFTSYLSYTTGEGHTHISSRENYERNRDFLLIISSIFSGEKPKSYGQFKEFSGNTSEQNFRTLFVYVLFLAAYIVLIEKDSLLLETITKIFSDRYKGSLQDFYKSGSHVNVDPCNYCGQLFDWNTGRGIKQPPHCGNNKCKNRHIYQTRKNSEVIDLKLPNWAKTGEKRGRCKKCRKVNWLNEQKDCSKCFLGKR